MKIPPRCLIFWLPLQNGGQGEFQIIASQDLLRNAKKEGAMSKLWWIDPETKTRKMRSIRVLKFGETDFELEQLSVDAQTGLIIQSNQKAYSASVINKKKEIASRNRSSNKEERKTLQQEKAAGRTNIFGASTSDISKDQGRSDDKKRSSSQQEGGSRKKRGVDQNMEVSAVATSSLQCGSTSQDSKKRSKIKQTGSGGNHDQDTSTVQRATALKVSSLTSGKKDSGVQGHKIVMNAVEPAAPVKVSSLIIRNESGQGIQQASLPPKPPVYQENTEMGSKDVLPPARMEFAVLPNQSNHLNYGSDWSGDDNDGLIRSHDDRRYFNMGVRESSKREDDEEFWNSVLMDSALNLNASDLKGVRKFLDQILEIVESADENKQSTIIAFVKALQNTTRAFKTPQRPTEIVIPERYLKGGDGMVELDEGCGFYVPFTALSMIENRVKDKSDWREFVSQIMIEVYRENVCWITAKGKRGCHGIHPDLYTGLYKLACSRSGEKIDIEAYQRKISKIGANKKDYQSHRVLETPKTSKGTKAQSISRRKGGKPDSVHQDLDVELGDEELEAGCGEKNDGAEDLEDDSAKDLPEREVGPEDKHDEFEEEDQQKISKGGGNRKSHLSHRVLGTPKNSKGSKEQFRKKGGILDVTHGKLGVSKKQSRSKGGKPNSVDQELDVQCDDRGIEDGNEGENDSAEDEEDDYDKDLHEEEGGPEDDVEEDVAKENSCSLGVGKQAVQRLQKRRPQFHASFRSPASFKHGIQHDIPYFSSAPPLSHAHSWQPHVSGSGYDQGMQNVVYWPQGAGSAPVQIPPYAPSPGSASWPQQNHPGQWSSQGPPSAGHSYSVGASAPGHWPLDCPPSTEYNHSFGASTPGPQCPPPSSTLHPEAVGDVNNVISGALLQLS